MKLLSINVSHPKLVPYNKKNVETAIFKEPTGGPVRIQTRNLNGDRQADLENHGGLCKAVYAYSHENYNHWAQELDRTDFAYGQFGENLTVEGMLEEDVNVGDIIKVGDALLQITQPRVPCFKLGVRMGGLNAFPKQFLKSGRVGFYLSVLKEGNVTAGEPIECIESDPNAMSVRNLNDLMHFDTKNMDDTVKALNIGALAPGWVRAFEKRLEKAGVPFDRRNCPLESECCSGT